MTKRIISLLLIAVLALSLLAACGKGGPLTVEEAIEIALDDLGIKEKDATSLDIHPTTVGGEACYVVYVSIGNEHWEYVVHGHSGEILIKEETDHGHSH